MKNEIQTGNHLSLTAPAGGVVSGKLYNIGDIVVVAEVDAAATESFVGLHSCVVEYNVAAGDTPAEGEIAYFDTALDELSNAAGAGKVVCGWFTTAKDADGNAQFKIGSATA